MTIIQLARRFHAAPRLAKDKHALKQLAKSMSKGRVKKGKDSGRKARKPNEVNETTRNLQHLYESLLYMSEKDLAIQQNLDRGQAFRSFPGDHWLDRKAALRSLPDKFDAAKTPLAKILQYYKQLDQLDKDKTVQMKYYKQYLRNYSDPIQILIQEFNSIDDKFKMMRRGELENMNLSPNAFLHRDNLFRLPYNVTGFDRSLSGFPLRRGRQSFDDANYPREFIQDLNLSNTTNVRLQKKDLDFVEYSSYWYSLDPSTVGDVNSKAVDAEPEKYELALPKNLIVVDELLNYEKTRFKVLEQFEDIIVSEVNSMKTTLEQELTQSLSNNKRTRNLLFFHLGMFRNNQFKLCKPLFSSGDPVKFVTLEFNLIPHHNLFTNSIKSNRRLYRHLLKVFHLNLRDQIEALTRIKYEHNKEFFTREVYGQMSKVINTKLMKLFRSLKLHRKFSQYQGITFTPVEDRPFFRLYKGKLRRNTALGARVRKVYASVKASKWLAAKRFYGLRRQAPHRNCGFNLRTHDLVEVASNL